MEGQDWATVVAQTPEMLEKFNIAISISSPLDLYQKNETLTPIPKGEMVRCSRDWDLSI